MYVYTCPNNCYSKVFFFQFTQECRRFYGEHNAENISKVLSDQVNQIAGKAKEIDWIRLELKGIRELWDKNLVPFNRVTALERDGARLEGDRGGLVGETRGILAHGLRRKLDDAERIAEIIDHCPRHRLCRRTRATAALAIERLESAGREKEGERKEAAAKQPSLARAHLRAPH